jgi:hypothetical protein
MSGSDTVLRRHEAKYVIPSSMVDPVREYLKGFCEPDPHGRSYPPVYTITTLQLDGPGLPLHHAKQEEQLNRFKLRVRTYDEEDSPVFMEVKQKMGDVIVKSRAKVARGQWGPHLLHNTQVDVKFGSDKEYVAFLTFVRLARELQAQPVVRIRYERESYFGVNDEYARVSLDRHLVYQPADDWSVSGQGGRWLGMDSSLAQNKLQPWSGVILELKTLSEAPRWMVEMTREFDLVRDGNCKYSSAISSESLFRGVPRAPAYAAVLQDY